MINFKEFLLTESLNSPVPFYATKDTKLPVQIYSTFEIDDIKYGMSFVLTKYDRVYQLDLYRVVNKYRKPWNFIKPIELHRRGEKTYIKGIYVGSAHKDYINKLIESEGDLYKIINSNEKVITESAKLIQKIKKKKRKKKRSLGISW